MDSFSDLKELLRLAQSPAGQQLIALLRQRGGDRLPAALVQASAGDYWEARQLLSELLSQEDAQALVRALEAGK